MARARARESGAERPDGAARRVVVVGGGFGGVEAAQRLRKRLDASFEVVLFSRENHLVFTPLLTEVVGASLNPLHAVWPVRQMTRGVLCRTANVLDADLAARVVRYEGPDGEVLEERYDHLVLAPGSETNLDVLPGLAAHGWPLKTLGDALRLRNRVLAQLERAEVASDADARRRRLCFAVVGGGYSGVEVAGAIHDLVLRATRYYANVPRDDVRVVVLEGGPRILRELPESLADFARRKMQARGIDVRTGAAVSAVTASGVRLGGGEVVEAGTVVCAIGIAPSPLLDRLGLPQERGRVRVRPDLGVEGQGDVWAVGDCAHAPNAHDGTISPPTAQFALRQARTAADNVARTLAGEPTRPFRYRPQGMLATIGHQRAVGEVFGLRVAGFPAFFLWRGVYWAKMPSWTRKAQIAFEWAWEKLFPPDLVQVRTLTTSRLGRAHYAAGEVVVRAEGPSDRVLVVERGRAEVRVDGRVVEELEPGDHWGAGGPLEQGRTAAEVRATEPLDVLTVDRRTFDELAGRMDALRREVERSTRSRRASVELVERAAGTPALRETRVRDVMRAPVATLPAGISVAEALRRSREGGHGGYPIVDPGGRLVAILTRSDLYRAALGAVDDATPVEEVASRPVLTIPADASLERATLLFLHEPVKRLVVVAPDAPDVPIGMLTPFDFVEHLRPVRAEAPAAARPEPAPTP